MTENAKMLSSKWHRKQEHFFIHIFLSFLCILFVKKHFSCRKKQGNEGAVILDYVSLWAHGQFDWTKLTYFTYRSCIQQNKTSIKPLRHTLRKCVWTKSSCGPQGSGLDQNCTCTTRPWGQQNVTINRFLQYLITEEIKEQDIVYVQTDGRPDDERVSHKLDWSSTSRAKNCIHSNNTLILQKAHISAFRAR